jgi:hypothetical protein
MKLGIILLLVVLVLSSVLVIFNYGTPQNQIAQPSPSAFVPKEWMQFIPANIEGFRFMNMSTLSQISGLFSSTILLNLTTLGMNITTYDVKYGLDMQNVNGSVVNIMVVNQTLADAVSFALENSSHVRLEYHNNTLYAVPPDAATETEGYWICVNRGAIVMCSGADLAFAALKSVVDANVSTFFNNDTLKIAYMITSNSKENFVFTYYTAGGNNTYNVDWLMGGVSNSTNLNVRVSYHFQTQGDLNSNYGNFTSVILSEASKIYTSGTLIIGDFTYAQSALRQVLMSI